MGGEFNVIPYAIPDLYLGDIVSSICFIYLLNFFDARCRCINSGYLPWHEGFRYIGFYTSCVKVNESNTQTILIQSTLDQT